MIRKNIKTVIGANKGGETSKYIHIHKTEAERNDIIGR